jgi:multiple sugar transport system permease protein
MTAEVQTADRPSARRSRATARLFDNRNFLGFLLMLPAAAILLVFLAYPLGL